MEPPTDPGRFRTLLEWELGIVTGFAFVVAVLVTVAWVASLVDERRSGRSSPWDMTTVASAQARGERRPRRKRPLDGKNMTFRELTEELGLKKASLGVYSAEGWHERFGWNDDAQSAAVALLRADGRSNPAGCRCGLVRGHTGEPRR
jgi:hypothetical protein